MSKVIQRTITITIIDCWCFFWPEAPTMEGSAAASDAPCPTADAPTTGQLLAVLQICHTSTSTSQTICPAPDE